MRRTQKSKSASDIAVSEDKPAFKNQSQFLANERNKKCFVSLLTKSLQSAGYCVLQAPDDADTLVVHTALHMAHCEPVNVIATDTHILVLLVYHITERHHDVFLLRDIQ